MYLICSRNWQASSIADLEMKWSKNHLSRPMVSSALVRINACSALSCVIWSDSGWAKWDHAISEALLASMDLGRTRMSPWMLEMAANDTISDTHPYLTPAERAQYQIGSTGSFAASLPASVMTNWSINPL